MALKDIALDLRGFDRDLRKAVYASAEVTGFALILALGTLDSGATRKVNVDVGNNEHFPGDGPVRPLAPTGRDGDDIDSVRSDWTPSDFLELDIQGRRRAILDVYCDALIRLGVARGWNTRAVDEARTSLKTGPIEFRWEGKPKTSPDRVLLATPRGELRETGAWVWLDVTDRAGTLVAVSREDKLIDTAPREFRVRAHKLFWTSNSRVVLEGKPGDVSRYQPLILEI